MFSIMTTRGATAVLALGWVLSGEALAGAEPAKPAEVGYQSLGTAAEARRICSALKPTSPLPRRRELLGALFATDFTSSGYAFHEYDADAQSLDVDFSRPLRIGDGVDMYAIPADDDDASRGFSMSQEIADQLAGERTRGLTLRVIYRLAPSELLAGASALAAAQDPCLRVSGGRILRIRIEPVGMALIGADGKVRASAGNAAPRAEGETEVSLGRPTVPGSKNLDAWASATRPLLPVLQACYEGGQRGSLVLGLAVNAEGRIDRVRTEIDALGDPNVAACAISKLRGFSGFPHRATTLSLPVFFALRTLVVRPAAETAGPP
jgi:hypothetical protein